ncbi:MAG: glycosyltransferase family 4 protein [Candidatus Brocadiales bacterium]|nr:glycosyltransferase family 4 protein [Candidatus Brocadiales bacterium]
MKIVVAGTRGFPGVQGGIESHCEHLYSQLHKKERAITVFTREPYVNSLLHTYNGIELISLTCPKHKFLETVVHTFKSVVRAKRLNPDILHIHAIGPSLFVPLARLLGMKVVITHHGPDYKRKKWSKSAKLFLMFCERMGVLFANKVITIAKNISDDLVTQYGRESTIIPNGVLIPDIATTVEVLDEYNLKKQKYVLVVGRLVPEKGFDDLIDAFSLAALEDWKLVIVGDADHEDKYSTELKKRANGIKNVVMTGFLKGHPLHEIYSHAGLFVLPSYYEGLPIVLLEAMSYGLSCLASSIPANRNVELADDRFFEAGDRNTLAEKLKAYTKKEWSEGDRELQLELINDKYNWVKIAEATYRVYERAMAD